jgi:hypothetical protein
MDSQTQLWRNYLHKDPTRFLLDADANPSVYLWYLIDLAHRPENSAVVIDARERVLFSPPVQEIFAAQHEEGYWESANSLAQPYYRATLWNLALLAELGIPRDSRRARAACEFALEHFLEEGGRFAGLDLIESCYLVHALSYFRPAPDERVARAARSLIELAEEADSVEGCDMALWAWVDFRQDGEVSAVAEQVRERLLGWLGERGADGFAPITFPSFDPLDALFVSRVLALYDCENDPRAGRLIESVLRKQNEQSRWPLERNMNGKLTTQVETESYASRWATMNALRVIVKLVMSKGG